MRPALLLAVLACAAPNRQIRPGARAVEDHGADLNAIARADYAQARGRALENAGPALLVGPSQITLVGGPQRLSMELAPPAYHQLKAVAHLALGIHSLFYEQRPP